MHPAVGHVLPLSIAMAVTGQVTVAGDIEHAAIGEALKPRIFMILPRNRTATGLSRGKV